MRVEACGRSTWYLYLVRTGSGALYTGISTDPDRRLREHERGTRGARSLRGRGPLELVHRQAVGDRSAALKLEYAVKRLSREDKERLVAGDRFLRALDRDFALVARASVEA